MSTPKRASAACPFCSWATSRSYNLPYHIASLHYSELKVTPMSGHYLSCYGKPRNSELEFVVCMSCRGGSMTGTSAKKRSEWVTKHAKNKACKEKHTTTNIELKKLIDDTTCQPIVSSSISSIDQKTNHTHACEDLWNTFKQKPNLKSYITEIEQTCTLYHEDDDDPYTFNAEDGIEQLVISAIGYKKHITQMENKIKTMDYDHERQMMDMRERILELERNVRDLQVALRQETYKAQNAQTRCDHMERDLNRYKEKYPLLPEEDPI